MEKTTTKNTNANKKKQQQQQTNVSSHSRAFLEEKNAPKIQVKFLKMPQEDSFPSQAADYKSETQLQTRPPTDVLHRPRVIFIRFRNT